MNNKISFPELVELLSKSTNASKKTCEAFLKSFFGAIEDALAAGETVKIKNLGVFKVAKVEARKSVHVNTGEEIEIPEHNKIIFAPDKSLADAVNGAFAEFETIELDDDAVEAIEGIDNEAPETPEVPQVPEIPEVPQPQDEAPETKSEGDCPTPPLPPEAPQPEAEPEPEAPETPVQTPAPVSAFIPPANIDNDDTAEEPDDDENDDDESRPSGKAAFFWGIITGFVASCILFFAISIAVGFPLVITSSEKEEDEPIEEVKAPEATAADTTTVAIATTEVAPAPAPHAKTEKLRTDTVGRTRFLTTMAREYYGDFRFWVYIYQENKSVINNPDKIKPGTVVVIPDAAKYGIDANNPESVKRAEALSKEIQKGKK
ncbi:MAG: HU family DNA-binding protein [Bacteroidales bacterium]|nr:HU family DNA-binding protein [Bacteroidales bacterium]